MEQTPRFDMKRPPVRTRWYLRPLTWVLSAPATLKHRTVIRKVGMENIRDNDADLLRYMMSSVEDVKGLIQRHIPNKKRVRWSRR